MIDVNKTIRFGRHSKYRIVKKATNWFVRRYIGCDIPCDAQISDSAIFAHSGLGCVVSKLAIIEENVYIQHGVTIGINKANTGAPTIHKNVFIGPRAIILGEIEIGEGSVIGAGSLVMHDIPPYTKVLGNNMLSMNLNSQ